MKTDAEILALLPPTSNPTGVECTLLQRELLDFYRRAFRDGAEAAIKVIEEHRIPVGNSSAGEMAAEWTLDALRKIREDIREELMGTNQGAV